MTRKHFKALADALKRVKPAKSDFISEDAANQAAWTWERTVDAVAGMCREANDLFDRAKFLTACGM